LTGVGSSQLSFNYTVTDAAGVQDATTGTYTISWIAAAPLPVKLTGFSARLKDCNSMLSWVTASEENFSHFEIQQSTNAVSFKTIGKVDSKNIATGSSYQFTAANETAGINYYRLLMIDINGAKEYSQIIQVNGCISSSMRAYPNPARDHIQVEFKGTDATGKYELTDLVGRILQRGVLQANTTNTITIRGAATGTYVLKVWVDGELQTKQIQIFQ
ncbi:MAG: T9SS type A sorting domain-containing protein, partial [Lacibacter sp.]|nr:T9SS type A sorting domain-containing protein [Lacibacter sp.]